MFPVGHKLNRSMYRDDFLGTAYFRYSDCSNVIRQNSGLVLSFYQLSYRGTTWSTTPVTTSETSQTSSITSNLIINPYRRRLQWTDNAWHHSTGSHHSGFSGNAEHCRSALISRSLIVRSCLYLHMHVCLNNQKWMTSLDIASLLSYQDSDVIFHFWLRFLVYIDRDRRGLVCFDRKFQVSAMTHLTTSPHESEYNKFRKPTQCATLDGIAYRRWHEVFRLMTKRQCRHPRTIINWVENYARAKHQHELRFTCTDSIHLWSASSGLIESRWTWSRTS